MTIKATVVADSINKCGVRLTSFACEYPRWILAEVNTHRMMSRSSSSSRAIPTAKILEQVCTSPAIPEYFGKLKAGMQDDGPVDADTAAYALTEWKAAAVSAAVFAQRLLNWNIHKQVVNRIVEPWMIAKTIISATEWENFYRLRVHADAQPEFRLLATAMLEAHAASTPKHLLDGEWHLPFYTEDLNGECTANKIFACVARCARVSYNNFAGKKSLADDLELCDRLMSSKPGHLSPFEHCASPGAEDKCYANYRGWYSYRWTMQSSDAFDSSRFDPVSLLGELTCKK